MGASLPTSLSAPKPGDRIPPAHSTPGGRLSDGLSQAELDLPWDQGFSLLEIWSHKDDVGWPGVAGIYLAKQRGLREPSCFPVGHRHLHFLP